MLNPYYGMESFYGDNYLVSLRSPDYGKKIVCIMAYSHPRCSCRNLFKNLKIQTLRADLQNC